MVGIPRGEISTSVSRVYVIVIKDLVCPNEVRFVKIALPDSFKNSSVHARYYYSSIAEDRAIQIIDVISWEKFIANLTDMVEEVVFDESKIRKYEHFPNMPKEIKMDFKDQKNVELMLNAWNDEQEKPITSSYGDILASILSELHEKNKKLATIENLFKLEKGEK